MGSETTLTEPRTERTRGVSGFVTERRYPGFASRSRLLRESPACAAHWWELDLTNGARVLPTLLTYRNWFNGTLKGSVDREHNQLSGDSLIRNQMPQMVGGMDELQIAPFVRREHAEDRIPWEGA